MTIDLLVDPAASGLAEPSGEGAAGAEGDDDSTVSFVEMLGGALAAAAAAIPPPLPAQPTAPGSNASGAVAGAAVPAVEGRARPAVIVPVSQLSLPVLSSGAAADGAPDAGIEGAVQTVAAPSAAPELPFAEVAAQLSIDGGEQGRPAIKEVAWSATAAAPPDPAATAPWAPFRAPRAATFTASGERAGTPPVAAAPAAVPPGQATPVDGPVDAGALSRPDSLPVELHAIASPRARTGAASPLARMAHPAASAAEPLAAAPPPAGGGELVVEASGPALPAGPREQPADGIAGPPTHAVHLPAHQSADPLPADAPARSDAAPAPARADDANQLPGGELGHSGARITVGEGDDRVSLLIALRGEHVRVEARAHSAVYADVLHQRADELATGLAERGLVLGSLSADVSGERAAQSPPQQQDERSDRRPAGAREPDPEPRPDRPRPRGVRAIA